MGTVTSKGYVPATLSEITTRLTGIFQTVYGDNIDVNPDSTDGQFIGLVSQMFMDNEEVCSAFFRNLDPASATDRWLDQRAAYALLTRKTGQRSVLNAVHIVGDPFATIPGGYTVIDGNNNRWLTNVTIQLSATGETFINLYSELFGSFPVGIGETLTPVTTQGNVVSVTATSDAVLGASRESDASLRNRIFARRLTTDSDLAYRIQQEILKKDGVLKATVYENDTDVVDARGLPPHSVWALVEGGTDADIAQAILSTKTGGAAMKGDVSTEILDGQGVKRVMKFSRFATVACKIYLEIVKNEGVTELDVDGLETELRNLVFESGQDVVLTRLYSTINKIPGFWVDVLQIGFEPGVLGTTNLSIPDGSRASFTSVDIVVQ